MTRGFNALGLLQAALEHLMHGRARQARDLALRVLGAEPSNSQALAILGSAEYLCLSDPHRVFFAGLKGAGYEPKVAIDVGAYDGAWSLALRDAFPRAEVLMIEAQQSKAPILARRCDENPGLRYRIALVGRHEADGVDFEIVEDGGDTTGSSLYPEQTAMPRTRVSLPMMTLDGIVAEQGFPPPDLLKIDVQGAELDVLAGGTSVLESVRLIHLEVSTLSYNRGAPLVSEVLSALGERGFVLFDVLQQHRTPLGHLVQMDILAVREDSPMRPRGVSSSRG